MRWIKRATGLLLALILAGALSACGGDATAEVEDARAKLDGAVSFETSYRTEMDYLVEQEQGEPKALSTANQLDVVMFTAPEPRAKVTSATEYTVDGERLDQALTIYLVAEGGGYMQYLTDGENWAKGEVDGSALEDVGIADSVSIFQVQGVSYKRAGTETLEGGRAVKYTGLVQGEGLVGLLEEMGALSSISSMSQSQQDKIKENLLGLKGQTVCVWVDQATGYPVRYEMDLLQTLREAEQKISETLGGYESGSGRTLTKAVVRMTCANMDKAPEIVLPPEAAQAKTSGATS